MLLTLSTGVFGTEPLLGLIPRIQEAGFRRLEVVDRGEYCGHEEVLDDLTRRARDCEIELPNWHLIQESPFRETKQVSRATVDAMKRSMDRGSRIGARNHVLHWYHRFLDTGYDALWREIVDEWVEHAARLGVRLLMETVPDKPSNERYVPSAEIIEFVSGYPADVLSVCVDVNHSNLQESLPDVVHTVRERLVSLHISDNDGHAEKHWLPGQGVIDYPSLFEGLESVGFGGFFVLEVGQWCKEPHRLSEIKRLHELGVSLLETKRPPCAP